MFRILSVDTMNDLSISFINWIKKNDELNYFIEYTRVSYYAVRKKTIKNELGDTLHKIFINKFASLHE